MSGGLAGAIANTICYPFDFARTRLASDLKGGQGRFKGIGDCIMTTVRQQVSIEQQSSITAVSHTRAKCIG